MSIIIDSKTGEVINFTENPPSAQKLNEYSESKAQEERLVQLMHRNQKLAASDWTNLPDSPLSTEQKSAWAEYRQALRDITKQESFPSSIIWPTEPV